MLRLPQLLGAALACAFFVTSCNDEATGPANATGLTGTLDIEESTSIGKIVTIDLATGSSSSTLTGSGPHRTPDGTVIMARQNGDLVEATNAQERVIVRRNTSIPNDEAFDDVFVNPRLSPNGRHVVYAGTHLQYAVYVVDRQTGELLFGAEPETNVEGYLRPSWVSDTEILVHGYQSNPGLHIIDIEAATIRRIDDDLAGPTDAVVSPERTRAAFILNGHVWIMNLDGSGLRQISTSAGTEKMPTWSPDGKWILVSNASKLYAVSVDGTTVVNIMETYRNSAFYTGSSQTSWR